MQKLHLVEKFFDRPDIYLNKRTGIYLRISIVKQFLGSLDNSSILDVGCGDGSISLPFLSFVNRLTLIDLSQAMLERSVDNTPKDSRNRVNYIKGDFLNYVPPQPFDIVLCIGVLAHVQSIPNAISKLASLTKPNGICIVQFSDVGNPLTRIQLLYYQLWKRIRDRYHYSLNTLTYSKFIKISQDNHFYIVKRFRYFSNIPGMSILPASFSNQLLLHMFKSRMISSIGTEISAMMLRK